MSRSIGLGVGCFWKKGDVNSPRTIRMIKDAGANAIELSATNRERITDLQNLDPNLVADFEYISIHGPGGGQNAPLSECVNVLEKLQEKFNAKCVVFHPDTIDAHDDWDVLAKSSLKVGIENMVSQKESFKTAKEVLTIIEKYGFKFVYDVNHIKTNDDSLEMAKDFNPLIPHIAHIHFSGMKEYDGFKDHFPAFIDNQTEIANIVPPNVPIIIESAFLEDFQNQATAEVNFVKKHCS